VAIYQDGWVAEPAHLITIPLVVLLARFPLLLDRGAGAIEVGFDSSVLMFLICTVPPADALVLWSVGVLATQLTNSKRATVQRFNLGVGLIGGAAAVAVVTLLRGPAISTPQEFMAVALGAAAYFAIDFVISAVSVALEDGTPVLRELAQAETWTAVACVVPFDSLGYLGAIVARSGPWWSMGLLAVPLVTLLIATQALTRGREHARRLGVLFDAAVRTQTLLRHEHVSQALLEDARKLLRLRTVEIGTTKPASDEIGAVVREGACERWIVAPARNRARSTVEADRQALEAMAAVASDAFARLSLIDETTHLAQHDSLTDLPNRALLLDRVEHALRASTRKGSQVALLFCDLDGFKQVNDRFGHRAGDVVLIDVAARLTGCIRDSDTVARLGGDEFAVLLEGVTVDEIDAACQRILKALRFGAKIDGHRLPLSTSIGVAIAHPRHTAQQLLLDADMAMYEAKNLGKNQWVEFQPSIGSTRIQRLELVESLRAAITERHLTVAYQPVVELSTGLITGVEALTRWSPDGRSIRPDIFIALAEETGLIVPLGDLILDLVADDAPRLMAAAGGNLSLSVNVSAEQLRTPTFTPKVEQILARVPRLDLVLEITERDVVKDDPASMETMRCLAAQAVRFAIDDFGVGYSSIGYLQHMPIHFLKSDATFAANIDHNERSCGLLASITAMAKALDIAVVVEGIERPSQVEHLLEHVGANLAQGFLLHRPMPAAQLVDILLRNRAAQLLSGTTEPVGLTSLEIA
jgi:diguanylate cyclase (GGDEF)-like protein